ncbi:Uncharacterised protein [Mycobacteroides abscessus subsp. abscessus]|nr:Uncharacterised protein [Mycobacteroides abscessus subsp. abscessus]
MRGHDRRPRFDEAVNTHAVLESAHAQHRSSAGGGVQSWEYAESVQVDAGRDDLDAIGGYPVVLDEHIPEAIRQHDDSLGPGIAETFDDVLGACPQRPGSRESAFRRPRPVEMYD